MDYYIYLTTACVYVLLIYWAVRRWETGTRSFARILLILVLAALLYDNAIIALGTSIGAGDLLLGLHAVRYWLHAFITPSLVLVAYEIWEQANLPVRSRIVYPLAWIVTISLILYQSYAAWQEVRHLRAVREFGVIHYTPAARSSMPLMLIIVMLVLVYVAIVLLLYRESWQLALGIFLMPFIMWLGLPLGGRAWSNVGELILMISLWLTLESRQLARSSHIHKD